MKSMWKTLSLCSSSLLSSYQINSTVSMSGLHAVSSSDDVKPPLGLKQLSSHSPGPMLSQKRLCSICGDRSSGDKIPSIQLLCSVPYLWVQAADQCITSLTLFRLPSRMLQVSTMGSTAVRAVKASSSGQYAKTWPTPVGTTKTVWWIRDRGTAASTVATRSAWPWGWREKVSKQGHFGTPCAWLVHNRFCSWALKIRSINLFTHTILIFNSQNTFTHKW